MTSVNSSSKIFDLFLYFNEEDLLLARLRYLWDYVDFFVIVESAHSFTGIKKKYTCEEILQKNIPKYKEKVNIYYNDFYINSNDIRNKKLDFIDTSSVPLIDYLIENKKHYGGLKEHWINDFYQRELLQCALLELIPQDSDLILLSDIDEIPKVETIDALFKSKSNNTTYFQMTECRHYINYISKKFWIGTVSTSVKEFKSKGVNYIRFYPKRNNSDACLIVNNSGWHFTSLGGIEALITKVESWGHQEFNNPITRWIMPYRLDRGLDVFGRNLGLEYLENITNIYDSKLIKLLDKKFIGKKFTIPSNIFLIVNYFVIFFEKAYQHLFRKI